MSFKSLNSKFVMTDEDFLRIRQWVKDHTGIKLSDAKRQMVFSRLSKRLRSLGFESFTNYLDYVEEEGNIELIQFKNAITTNLTSFFRESHHFDFLRDTIIPDIKSSRSGQQSKEIRIWSAGCSTGEEAYSIAIILSKIMPKPIGWDIKVLATDIDTTVLQKGKDAVYHVDRIEKVDEKLLKGSFSKFGDDDTLLRISDQVRRLVVFNQLNLMSTNWPMKKKFDVIFCRNVMIYFDKETQHTLVNRYCELLKEDGYLIIGHSETLFGLTEKLKLVGKNIYKIHN